MARDYAALRPVSSINGLLAAVVILLTIQGAWSQRVRVEEELEAFPTESVNLRCEFIDGGAKTKLTQVSWIWEPVEGQRDNIAVFHPIYGQSFPDSPFKDRVRFLQGDLVHPSIQISDLKMSDAGRYTCEYATYPSGNEQGTTNLVMLAKPRNSAQVVTVAAGSQAVVVAQCEAADGKPPATIQWVSGGAGDHTTSSTAGAHGTVTVRSEYRLVPTAADHGREVTCLVSQRTQDRADSFPIRLSVEYPPTVSIEGYDNNWYVGRSGAVLICKVDANPQASNVTWRAVSGPMPDSVVVEGNRLTVRKVDPAVNTTFVCEVQNRLGVSQDQVTTSIIEALVDPSSAGVVAGAVIGSLLALLLVVALVAVLLARSRRQQQRGYHGNGSDSMTTTTTGSGGTKGRLLFGGTAESAGKNGTGANNNGPVYTYREGCDATGTLTESADHHYHHRRSAGSTTPTAHDILLSTEMDEAERRKFDALDDSTEEEEEEERYDRFAGGGGGGGGGNTPAYHVRRGHGDEEEMGTSYLDDDDMESQRDGSVISRTAIYV